MNKITRQRGMTLVELLIAMGLGIFLMAGVLQVFLGSKQTFTTINAQSHMQENGRFAVDFIARTLRQGGYTTEINIDQVLDDNLRKETLLAQGDFAEGTVVFGVDNATLAGVKAATDVVQVRIQGAPDNQVLDCTGAVIAEGQWVDVSYSVGNAGEFQCETKQPDGATAAATLVEGVDDLQIQYGVNVGGTIDNFTPPGADEPEQMLSASRFVNAAQMSADDWPNVVSVRVALLASSDSAPLERSTAQTYQLLDNANVSYQDGKARQIFTQTINVRNPVVPAQ